MCYNCSMGHIVSLRKLGLNRESTVGQVVKHRLGIKFRSTCFNMEDNKFNITKLLYRVRDTSCTNGRLSVIFKLIYTDTKDVI